MRASYLGGFLFCRQIKVLISIATDAFREHFFSRFPRDAQSRVFR